MNVTVPVRMEQPPASRIHHYSAVQPVSNNYTINAGDNSQITVASHNVQQSQTVSSARNDIDALRAVLQDILNRLDALELTDEDRQDLRETVTESISELESDTPDTGKLRTPLRLIKRILTQIGSSMITGATAGSGNLAQQWVEKLARFL